MICNDPCHLVWQVSEIPWLESIRLNSRRPLPACPAGESDSDAAIHHSEPIRRVAWVRQNLIHLPREVAGAWACASAVLATESSSPAGRAGRGRSQTVPCASRAFAV